MTRLFSKKIVIIIVVLFIGTLLWWIGSNKTNQPQPTGETENKPEQSSEKEVRIISTKPDPLEEAIISATETIEITFNRSLENVGEFKSKIEPNIDYKVELSGDRKTARIIPTRPYELGTTYTLFIGTETKFDGVGRWGEEKIFHFKTIQYRGV